MNLSNRVVITSNIRVAPTDVIQPCGEAAAPDQLTLARAFLDFLAEHPQLIPRAWLNFGEQANGHVVCDAAHEAEALDALRRASGGGELYTASKPDAATRVWYGHVGPGEGVHVALFVYRGEMP